MLIYDNIETLSDIKDFIPEDKKVWGFGKILMTTRNANNQNNRGLYVKHPLSLWNTIHTLYQAITTFEAINYLADKF